MSVPAELAPKARAATVREAAEAGELVVVTLPLKNYKQVPVEPLVGKIVIDIQRDLPAYNRRLDAEELKAALGKARRYAELAKGD